MNDFDLALLRTAKVGEVLFDVLGEVRRVGREKYSILRCLAERSGQVPSPMHRHDRLARTGPTSDSGGAIERLRHELLLAGMQEDPRFFQRSVKDRGHFFVSLDRDESSA